MSYQTITDIAFNPAIQKAQLSNTIKDSPILSSSSNSFADLVSFYKADNKPADSSVSEPVFGTGEEEISANSVKSDETKTEKTETKKEVSKDADSVKEKSSDEKVEKTDLKEEKNPKNVKLEKKEGLKEEKVSKSEEKTEKKDKKLSSKDFAKLNHLTEKNETENVKASEVAANLQQKNETKNEIKVQKAEEKVTDALTSAATNVEIPVQVTESADVKNEETEFNFDQKCQNQTKKTLDKEGKITVEDLRTQVSQSDEVKNNKNSGLKVSEIKQTADNAATITMDLNQTANQNVLSLDNQSAASNGSNFQAMLNNQIKNSAPYFVKAGNLILKDNDQGTINLVLHPDDLGNVKIHLSLDGKTISGHITVASKEALQVFKDNAETLREAFIKNGFDAANFDVAYNNSSSFNQNNDFAQNDGSQMFAKHVYGSKAEAVAQESDESFENSFEFSNYSVNIVA